MEGQVPPCPTSNLKMTLLMAEPFDVVPLILSMS
jgi:hypothetical protein